MSDVLDDEDLAIGLLGEVTLAWEQLREPPPPGLTVGRAGRTIIIWSDLDPLPVVEGDDPPDEPWDWLAIVDECWLPADQAGNVTVTRTGPIPSSDEEAVLGPWHPGVIVILAHRETGRVVWAATATTVADDGRVTCGRDALIGHWEVRAGEPMPAASERAGRVARVLAQEVLGA